MSNGVLTGRAQEEKHSRETLIQQTEVELNALIELYKLRKCDPKTIVVFLENAVLNKSLAVPLLCGIIAAQFPENEVFTSDYLTNAIINSYNVRIAAGDRQAESEKDVYLRMIGRKKDHLTAHLDPQKEQPSSEA